MSPRAQDATLIGILERLAETPRPDQFLRRTHGEWTALSTGEFLTRVRRLAAFLIEFGIEPGDRIALLAENRPEWTIADFAILSTGAVTVPIFTTLSPPQIGNLIRHSGSRIVLTSGGTLLERLREAVGLLDRDMRVLIFDPPAGADASASAESARAGSKTHRIEEASLEEAYEHGESVLRLRPDSVERRASAVMLNWVPPPLS